MMLPIFGKSDGATPDASAMTTPFYVARKKIYEATTAFAEAQPVDKSQTMLRERFQSALVPLRTHFQGLDEIPAPSGWFSPPTLTLNRICWS
jgi:hypothetical protein